MQFNLNEIETLFEQIKDNIEYYEKTFIRNKVFTLFLGNGEKVKYTINEDNIPHLLGINLDTIRTLTNYTNKSSFELLKEVISEPYKLHKLFNEKLLRPENVFSKNIKEKLECFKENFKSDAIEILDETDFVCSFNREKLWEVSDKNLKFDYILVKTLKNGKIGVVCLIRKGMQCFAMSSLLFNSIEEATETFKELLTNQEITLLTGFEIYNKFSYSKFNRSITTNQKLEKLDNLEYYKRQYNCHIDISSEYSYTVHKLMENKNEKIETNFIIEEIVNSISKRKILKTNGYEDSSLLTIIDAWNNHIATSGTVKENSGLSYTEAIQNLKDAKILIENLEKENKKLSSNVLELTAKNTDLESENSKYKENEQAIMKILKPEN